MGLREVLLLVAGWLALSVVVAAVVSLLLRGARALEPPETGAPPVPSRTLRPDVARPVRRRPVRWSHHGGQGRVAQRTVPDRRSRRPRR